MRKSHFIALITGLIVMFAGPAAGLLGTVLGMMNAFEAAKQSGPAPSPADLSNSITGALTATVVGIAIGAVGMIVAIAAVIAYFATRPPRPAAPQPPPSGGLPL